MNPKNQKKLPDQNNGLVYKVQTRWLFHAHIKLKIPVFCDEALFDEFYSILEEVDRKYNSYREDSYFDRINKDAGNFVEVDQETISILKQVIFFSEFFDGEYDITIMPLIRLWGFYKDDQQKLPSNDEIREVREKVDYRKIEIEGDRVRIAKGQEIITGSFIKAYAVDRLVEKMRSLGITDAIINAGGSTIMAVNNNIHPYWSIDVTNPEREKKHLFNLRLSNDCFSTSAQSKMFVDIDNKRYGHILSPRNGYPSENRQVGVITENCFIGDIISTGLFNQSVESFNEKITKLSQYYPVSGFLMDKDGKIVFSSNFEE